MHALLLTRACLRLAMIIAVTFLAVTLLVLVAPLGERLLRPVRQVWLGGLRACLGLRVDVVGAPSRRLPTLVVANHVSWIDIVVLGALVDGSFVAKAEVAGWPLIGWISRKAGTLFIRRHWRDAPNQRDAIAGMLAVGRNVVLFPEGTSTDGTAVQRFKSSLFAAVDPERTGRPVAVQAVSLAYLPEDGERCCVHAWYGDDEFVPHLWQVLLAGGCDIELAFHEPLVQAVPACRKELARSCEAMVAETMALLLAEHRADLAAEALDLPQDVLAST